MAKRKSKTIDEINRINSEITENWDPQTDRSINDKTRFALMARSRIGIPRSEETKLKQSASLKGRVRPPEVLEKMSLSAKGKSPSEETRKKLSLANKGRVKSEQERKKLSKAGLGRQHSEETKRKISILQRESRGRRISIEGVVYNSAADAVEALGIGRSCILHRTRSTSETWKDYFFVDKQ